MVVTPRVKGMVPGTLSRRPAVGGTESGGKIGKSVCKGVLITTSPGDVERLNGGGQVAGSCIEWLERCSGNPIDLLVAVKRAG